MLFQKAALLTVEIIIFHKIYVCVWWQKSKYRHLNHPVQLVLENAISLFDFAQWETMRDKWSGVNLSFFNQAEDFFSIASIHTTGFKAEVLAIHLGQGKNLCLVV